MGSSRSRLRGAVAPVIEALAARTLLSVNLDGSTLRIVGTEGDDSIVLAANKRFINFLSAGCNDELLHVALTAIDKIEITAFGGNDRVLIDSTLDPLVYRAFVDGGAGHDRIYTSTGNDTILAGEGNDKIYSGAGNDSIDAGSGRDLIVAGDGANTVIGGAHSDNITTGWGNDAIYPGKGNDHVDAGEGNDLISDPSGADTILAGGGNDSGKIAGAGGVVNGGDGNDTFVATGGTALHGLDGKDNLQGALLFGGNDDDTLAGLLGNDEIHGGAGDDLIRGYNGNDSLFGDEGKDAIFGGADNDTLYGGAGDDNLYGTDGHLDKHPELAGRDDGFGEDGLDWFETGYKWNKTDRRDGNDRELAVQNDLPQDTSYGWYTGSGVTYAGNYNVDDYGIIDFVVGISGPTAEVETKWLGAAGWLSSGAYDSAEGQFAPPPMAHATRMLAKRVILQLPASWKVGAMSSARDEIVWYQLRREGGSSTNIATEIPSLIPRGSSWQVPTIDEGAISLAPDTPELFSGVDGGKYRFLGVKRGTVLISAAGTVAEPTQYTFNTTVLPIHLDADIRLTGYDRLFRQQSSFDAVPTGGPRSLDGILVEGGAIWLPIDGSEAYFSSGNN